MTMRECGCVQSGRRLVTAANFAVEVTIAAGAAVQGAQVQLALAAISAASSDLDVVVTAMWRTSGGCTFVAWLTDTFAASFQRVAHRRPLHTAHCRVRVRAQTAATSRARTVRSAWTWRAPRAVVRTVETPRLTARWAAAASRARAAACVYRPPARVDVSSDTQARRATAVPRGCCHYPAARALWYHARAACRAIMASATVTRRALTAGPCAAWRASMWQATRRPAPLPSSHDQ